MSFTLDSRVKLRQAFFRLMDTDDTDDGLIEQDTETNEAVNYFLQHGLWKAQSYVIQNVDKWRWLTLSAAITWTTADDGYYSALPTDFLRLAGKAGERFSPLNEADGAQWGDLIDPADRYVKQNTNSYWIQNERLYRVLGSTPPTTLYMNYHHRHAILSADGTAIDFDIDKRPLIVAYAGQIAMAEAWIPGGATMIAKIEQNARYWEKYVAEMARRTQEPRRLKSKDVLNSNRWM